MIWSYAQKFDQFLKWKILNYACSNERLHQWLSRISCSLGPILEVKYPECCVLMCPTSFFPSETILFCCLGTACQVLSFWLQNLRFRRRYGFRAQYIISEHQILSWKHCINWRKPLQLVLDLEHTKYHKYSRTACWGHTCNSMTIWDTNSLCTACFTGPSIQAQFHIFTF